MVTTRTIDIHTHILTQETAALLSQAGAKVTITPDDAELAALDVGGVVYRPFPTGGFDIARRLQDMDATGIDVHVLSATPQTYLYKQEAALGATTSAIQNDQIAKHIAAHPTRFMGIATLPMQDPKRAADELTRAMSKLGLRGAMFASNILGKNLDDPSFEPLWAAAEELGAFMFIHPNNVAGAERLKSYYLRQSDRQSARHHHRRRLSGVRRRHGPASPAEGLPRPCRRLHALPGRALDSWLARAAGAEEEHSEGSRPPSSAASSTTPSRIPTNRSPS